MKLNDLKGKGEVSNAKSVGGMILENTKKKPKNVESDHHRYHTGFQIWDLCRNIPLL